MCIPISIYVFQMNATVNEFTNESPLDRIKEELPEFCQLVAVARMMCNSSDKKKVKKQVESLLEILLDVPIKDAIPSIEQRKGSESFLLAASTYTSSYAAQLDAHTNKLLNSCRAFNEAVQTMEKMKRDVLCKYSSTLMEFSEIVASAKQPNNKLNEYLDSTIARVVAAKTNEKVVKHPRPLPSPPHASTPRCMSTSELVDQLDEDELEPLLNINTPDDRDIIPVLTRETPGGGLHTFFQQNNSLATTNQHNFGGVTVASMYIDNNNNNTHQTVGSSEGKVEDDDDSDYDDDDESDYDSDDDEEEEESSDNTNTDDDDDSDISIPSLIDESPPPSPLPLLQPQPRTSQRLRRGRGRGRGSLRRH